MLCGVHALGNCFHRSEVEILKEDLHRIESNISTLTAEKNTLEDEATSLRSSIGVQKWQQALVLYLSVPWLTER